MFRRNTVFPPISAHALKLRLPPYKPPPHRPKCQTTPPPSRARPPSAGRKGVNPSPSPLTCSSVNRDELASDDNSILWFWDCHLSSTSSGLPSDTTLMTFPGRYSPRTSKKFQMFPWLANLLFWFTLLSRCCTGWSGFRPWPKWSSIPRKKFSKSSWEGKRNLDKTLFLDMSARTLHVCLTCGLACPFF